MGILRTKLDELAAEIEGCAEEIKKQTAAVKTEIETLSSALIQELQTLRADVESIPPEITAHCDGIEADIMKLKE